MEYRHPFPERKVDPGEPLRQALAIAKQLATELGIEVSSDNDLCRVETPAVAASSGHGGPEKWLIDTGSGYDLEGRNDVRGWAMDSMLEDRAPIDLHTANGITTVDKTVFCRWWGLWKP